MSMTYKEELLAKALIQCHEAVTTLSKTEKALNFRKMRLLERTMAIIKKLSDYTVNNELGREMHNCYAFMLRCLDLCHKHRYDPTIVREHAEKVRLVFTEGIWKKNWTYYKELSEEKANDLQ